VASRQTAVATAAARAEPLSRDVVVDAALRLVEDHGVRALTMRRLAAELDVAVTAIYWHVGNRSALLDELVDRIVSEIGAIRPTGATPEERIASVARSLRRKLLARPHLVGLAHERGRTGEMFQPALAALAQELASQGLRGREAELAAQAIEFHVIGSVILERAAARGPGPGDGHPPADHNAVFEFGLRALVDSLVRSR